MGGLQVIGELAEIGYDAEWRVVSAAGVGAPHRRDRIIIVAYPNGAPRQQQFEGQIQEPNAGRRGTNVADPNNARNRTPKRGNNKDGAQKSQEWQDIAQFGVSRRSTNMANSCEQQLNGRGHQHSPGEIKEREAIQEQVDRSGSNVADTDAREIVGRHGGDATNRNKIFSWGDYERGTQSYEGWQWWEVEPDVGRVADGVPSRVDRLKGLGNAVVPQVAEYIGRLVMAAHNNS